MTTKIEQRVEALEKKLSQMEQQHAKTAAWRAKIVPPEIYDDPNIQELMADAARGAVERWKSCLAAHGVQLEEARQREMAAQALKELEAQGKSENHRLAAEVLAVIQYYEKHGELPEGCDYEIDDDGMTPVNTRIF